MFNPKTDKIKMLAAHSAERIRELESIFSSKTNIYIDYANVRPWSTKLGWNVDPKRLKQFLDSFSNIKTIKFYHGTLVGDHDSEKFVSEVKSFGYVVKTKPVKIMRLSIDVSSIPRNSPDILKNFVRAPLLRVLKLEAIEYLNRELSDLNRQGKRLLEDRKCNFDVEIGRDMLLDYSTEGIENFVLWSGDSDFADPLRQLLADGKRVYIFATARRIASE